MLSPCFLNIYALRGAVMNIEVQGMILFFCYANFIDDALNI